MNIAYLIAAHDNPKVVKQQVALLKADNVSFHIHVDAKTPIEPFENELKGEDSLWFITDRVNVYWGDFSQVEATLKLIGSALKPALSAE